MHLFFFLITRLITRRLIHILLCIQRLCGSIGVVIPPPLAMALEQQQPHPVIFGRLQEWLARHSAASLPAVQEIAAIGNKAVLLSRSKRAGIDMLPTALLSRNSTHEMVATVTICL